MLENTASAPAIVSGDAPEDIARDVAVVQQIGTLAALLEVLSDLTGMRLAAVARVTENTWTVCAIRDTLDYGLAVGSQLPVGTTLCLEMKHLNGPIAFNDARADAGYCNHQTPRLYNFRSYVSVPIVLDNGRYFGSLFALDPEPLDVNNPKVIRTFTRFAAIIAGALRNQELRDRDLEILSDERTTSELREQFIAILGHDLRNPLQAVLASSDLLRRRRDDPASVVQLAGRIETSVKRMSLLIDDVLDFARAKLGRGIDIAVDNADDLSSGLEHVIKELQDGNPNREIIATVDVKRSVRCDLARVQQVASNLIGNALTHGAPGRPVTVSAYTERDHFVLAVWNDGEPIPAESVRKIFEPFWRNSTSASRQGLGLGLHICSQIVGAHKGDLSVTSTAATGTTFTARLPLQ